MTDDQRAGSFIAGVRLSGRGLFHLKLRRFARPGLVEMQTGSLNPSEEAMNNDETVIEIKDAALQVSSVFPVFVRTQNLILGRVGTILFVLSARAEWCCLRQACEREV